MSEDGTEVADIDYEKSIKKERLVYKRKGFFKWMFLVQTGYFLLVAVGFGYAGINEFVQDSNRILAIFMFLSALFLIASVLCTNVFAKVNGVGLLKNKEDAFVTLKHFYPDLKIQEVEENAFRIVKLSSSFNTGKSIVVIFHNKNVYFNNATLGRASAVTELFGIFNYLKSKKIATYFTVLQDMAKPTQ